jgi:hypothetical protein
MHSTLDVPYIELRVPIAKTEREFLQLAVQAAARKYRLLHQQMGASDGRIASDRGSTTLPTVESVNPILS